MCFAEVLTGLNVTPIFAVLEDIKFFGRKPVLETESQGHPCHCLRSTSHLGWFLCWPLIIFLPFFDRQNTELEWITKKRAKHPDNLCDFICCTSFCDLALFKHPQGYGYEN